MVCRSGLVHKIIEEPVRGRTLRFFLSFMEAAKFEPPSPPLWNGLASENPDSSLET